MKTEPAANRNYLRRRQQMDATFGVENRLFLLLTNGQWQLAIMVGTLIALIFWPLYSQVSPWVGVALFVVGATIVHLRYASRYIIPFPHITILIAALQYVLGAWVSAYWPANNPLYDIGLRLPLYLPFATLVLLACVVGWGLGLSTLQIPAHRPLNVTTPRLLVALDTLLVLGFVGILLVSRTQQTSFGFLFVLLANLRYLGVYGRMVCHGPGWGWRLVLVAVVELLFSTERGAFHGFVLFGFWTFALWAFVFRMSWRGVLVACAAALLLLPALQSSKTNLRRQIADNGMGDNLATYSQLDKISLWSSSMVENFRKTLGGDLGSDFIGDSVARYNQGWIVDRVMQHVPTMEPYARGETLKDAVISTLVPRAFYPDKVITGGLVNMERFAGVRLDEGTSMNLGYAGEMYANFGYWGGIIGCGLYCLAFSLLFRAVCIRAFVSPLWWAVMPYIAFVVFKAEDDVVGVVNWTAKACLVMAGICLISPAIRQALFPEQGDREARAERTSQKLESRGRGFSPSDLKHSGGFHPRLRRGP